MNDYNDRLAFLSAVIARPMDDGPRRMYADWLTERGDPRGEFIKIQCDLAGMKSPISPWCSKCGWAYCSCTCTNRDHHPPYEKLRRVERQLLIKYGVEWASETFCHTEVFRLAGVPKFSRGFVSQISLPAGKWLTYQDYILSMAPIEAVDLTTRIDWFGPGSRDALTLTSVVAGGYEAGVKYPCKKARWGCWWNQPPPVIQRILEVEWASIQFSWVGYTTGRERP